MYYRTTSCSVASDTNRQACTHIALELSRHTVVVFDLPPGAPSATRCTPGRYDTSYPLFTIYTSDQTTPLTRLTLEEVKGR